MSSASERKKKRYAEDPEYREKKLTQGRTWYWENWEKRRDSFLRYRYGSALDYDALFARQGGVCRVCGHRAEPYLCVDHNHRTGRVRGLLCRGCNLGLGNFKEDPRAMRAAADLIEEDLAHERMTGSYPSPGAPAVPRPTSLAACRT